MGAIAEDWTRRLQRRLDREQGPFRRVRVLAETASTQDAARRLAAGPGDVIVALRQTRGRGRLGRGWADTGDEGVAASFVIEPAAPERLAIASAVAAARVAEAHLPGRAGIKWPNDVVVRGRKLAGVLIERSGGVAVVGIGMNVGQSRWPPELEGRAVSLAELGADATRIDVVETLLSEMGVAIGLEETELVAEFRARDVLTGGPATLRVDGRSITGTVVRIDPMQGLLVRDGRREEYLPAAVTTVLSFGRRRDVGKGR